MFPGGQDSDVFGDDVQGGGAHGAFFGNDGGLVSLFEGMGVIEQLKGIVEGFLPLLGSECILTGV